MQVIHHQLQATLRAQGHELPAMGVGVSSGEAIAGEFGHPVRSEFTALGRIVNLGSRLCSAAQGGQVLISEATYDMIRPLATANNLGSMGLKGISQPTTVYELTHIEKGA
jgi:adenylate cyclase